MNANRIHLAFGLAVVVVFLYTGFYMQTNFPALYRDNEAIRYMYRAGHIYILFSGLLNIIIGIYLLPGSGQWKANLQGIGSFLLLVGPLLLIFAFFYEPPSGSPERVFTLAGVLFLMLGTICHMFNKAFKPTMYSGRHGK